MLSETGPPCLQLLSNGCYHAMVTDQGGGLSRWKGLALMRWHEDATCDAYGAFRYISDADSGHVWSTTRQPTLLRSGALSVSFAPGLATFRSRAHGVEVQIEIAVSAGKASYYDLPTECEEAGSLYEHCVRAVTYGLRFGEHGLPLMGAGDWNDGMNLVGAEGRGESVWLAFFLDTVLAQFGRLANHHCDGPFAQRCAAESTRLRGTIEQSAWDGEWYRRGWFDDGSPLGTSANTECRIDSIAQSRSVLSGAADAGRARSAMAALDTQLVDRDAALIKLLAPPFDHSEPSPGYIQGYVPGVRENGGQYTHAAVWAAMAFAALGDAARAWELFAMLDPVRHAYSPQAVATYKTEPYVLASDVYALPPHAGRGGWTWYTGSAGWMLRFILESQLGLSVESDRLRVVPCVPKHWVSFQLNYRYRETLYRIKVLPSSPEGDGPALTLDGAEFVGSAIFLIDDRREHAVVVRIHQTGDA